MRHHWILTAAVVASIAIVLCSCVVHSAEAQEKSPKIPSKFQAMDTSRFMLGPDPCPLEKVRAFPNLQFERPIELTHAGDGTNRVFVAEQRGIIQVFDNQDHADSMRPFLDIREAVLRDHNEEGLLGLAFHPKFKENGQFFVYYSAEPRKSVISQFKVSAADTNQADADSEKVLLEIDQPFGNHNGGTLRFGPDGYLYIGLGDGGAAHDPMSHGQNLETLLGSILRIDIDQEADGKAYAIPKDNPFVGRDNARGEIWAYGLRNVWRMAFDRETGELWAADVGQDRFEEVNLIERGGNYGWNEREGAHNFKANSPPLNRKFIEPKAEYFREEGISVTGGQVYRGEKLKDYVGAYFYGDFGSGNVWALWHGEGQVQQVRRVAETGLEITAFGEDQSGEMYLCDFKGLIYRLEPREIDFEAAAREFPAKLSETGLFTSVPENMPAAGMIPYELNLPFWSDYSVKDRYLVLPEKAKVEFDPREKWKFPVGSVFVKTFWMHRDRVNLKDPFRLETRLLVNSPDGWKGYTYVYNKDQTEATLLEGSLLRPVEVTTESGTIKQPYYFPARHECMACHTKQEGFVLGMTTRQMNHTLDYHGESANQIELLSHLEVFTEKVDADAETLENFPIWGFGNLNRSGDPDHPESTLARPKGDATELARAWLEVNCATCHRPQGIAPGGQDMRFHTPLDKTKMLNQPVRHTQLTPPEGTVLKPGQPHLSELLIRAANRGERRMPPLGSNVVDPHSVEVLRKWIADLE